LPEYGSHYIPVVASLSPRSSHVPQFSSDFFLWFFSVMACFSPSFSKASLEAFHFHYLVLVSNWFTLLGFHLFLPYCKFLRTLPRILFSFPLRCVDFPPPGIAVLPPRIENRAPFPHPSFCRLSRGKFPLFIFFRHDRRYPFPLYPIPPPLF